MDLIKAIFDKGYRMQGLGTYGFYRNMPDEEYLKKLFKARFGKELNLKEPKTFNEKLNWIKLHDRKPIYTTMADKYAVKKYVSERIGEEHVAKLYGVWERFEDIDLDALPDSFVLKVTHDSGANVICPHKADFSRAAAKRLLTKSLKRSYYWSEREWPYKDIKPRIIAEEYFDSLGKPDSVEYKLTTCNGKVKFFTLCRGPAHDTLASRTNDHFDRDYRPLYFSVYYQNSSDPPPIPAEMEEMIAMAEKLAEGISSVRVDFYLHEGRIMFGELTFFTWGAMMDFQPPEWDEKLGEWLDLSDVEG